MMRHSPSCLVIATSLLLASCSTVEFAYSNAPSYLAGEIEDAFDLNDEQIAQLDSNVEQFFSWHRQHELPRYQQFLDASADTIADGITAAEFLDISNNLRHAWERSMARAVDDFAGVLASLTPAQIDHYEVYFREDSEEYDDYLEMTQAQREDYRVKKGLELLEDWYGKFEDKKREQVRVRLRQLPEFYLGWINYREARQRALLDALRKAPTLGFSSQQLHAIMLDAESDYARAFKPVRTAYWHAYSQMIENLSDLLTSAQRQHVVKRLRNYAEGIEGLRGKS